MMKKNNKKKENQLVRASKQYVKPDYMHWGGEFEYKMPKTLYEELLKECGKNKSGDAQKYLCDFVNTQCGLLGACVRVTPC